MRHNVLARRKHVLLVQSCYGPEVDFQVREACLVPCQSSAKISKVTAFLRRPGHLGQRDRTRKHHILQMFYRGDILAPERTLSTEYVPRLVGCEYGWNGVEGVDFIQRDIATNGEWFRWIVRLVIIEVDMCVGDHDHI